MKPTLSQIFFRVALPAVVLLAAPARLNAQEVSPELITSQDYLVENWQAEEGLPRNTITSIAQDQTGYLWLGTPYGVVRFDGIRFQAVERDISPVLAQGEVWQVLSGRDGALWIATRRWGVVRLAAGKMQRYGWNYPAEYAAVDSLAEDKDGVLWVTMANGTLRKFLGGELVTVADLSALAIGPHSFTLKTDVRGELWFFKQGVYGRIEGGAVTNVVRISGSVVMLAPSHDGGMWLSTGNDLRHLPPGQMTVEVGVLPLVPGNGEVKALYEDRTGTLWVSTLRQGLFRLVAGRFEKIEGVHHVVLTIAEDGEGNLWLGTEGGGLFKLRPRAFKLLRVAEGLPEGNVMSVCEDWIIPQSGNPLKITTNGSVEADATLMQGGVVSVLQDAAGGVWFGTPANEVIHLTKQGERRSALAFAKNVRQLRVLHYDRKGNFWVGGFPGGLAVLPAGKMRNFKSLTPHTFSRGAITAIAESKEGNMWVGNSLGSVFRLDDSTWAATEVTNGLAGSPVGALMFSSDDTLWVGTLGGGLGCWRDGKFRFATLDAGLPDNVISQLIEDDAGWLWAGSSLGIFRVRLSELDEYLAGRRKTVAAVHYGRSDGLENIQCTAGCQPSVWKMINGELRFATSKGVVAVNPALLPVNVQPPPLVLEQVLVDGLAVTNRTNLQLPHDYRRIEFRYAALNYTSPDKVRYRRQLSGFDEGWIDGGRERTAAYPRLPPGRYKFRFTACNNDGIWNEKPVALSFEVQPALWQTRWFRLGALLAFAGVVAALARSVSTLRMRRRLRQLEQANVLERERARIARDLHDDLGARLTQMAFLTDLAATKPVATGEMKQQLREVSTLARHATRSLDETVWIMNPQKDSLPHLIKYIGHYANEFFRGTPIRCRQRICVSPPDCALSSELRQHVFFAVKEALNNALKHSGATEVWVRIGVRRPLLRIVIADNGRGFSPEGVGDSRQGLANLRRRLQEVAGRCVIRSAPGQGTRLMLRVRLPLEETPKGNAGAAKMILPQSPPVHEPPKK